MHRREGRSPGESQRPIARPDFPSVELQGRWHEFAHRQGTTGDGGTKHPQADGLDCLRLILADLANQLARPENALRQRDAGWPGKLRRHQAIYVGPVHIEVDLAQQLGIALSFSSGKHSTLVRDEDSRNESNHFAPDSWWA